MSKHPPICTVYDHAGTTETDFLFSDHVYGAYGSIASVYERYQYVLTFIPEMRGKHLWDLGVNAVLTDIYAKAHKSRVLAAVELCLLRIQFFTMLDAMNLGFRHVNQYEVEGSCVWRDKLWDRYYQTRGSDHFKRTHGSREPSQFVPGPLTTDNVQHRWLQ